MNNVVVTDVPRAPGGKIDELAGFGVATVHEAIGRRRLPRHRASARSTAASRIGGSAVTALCWPGDNS